MKPNPYLTAQINGDDHYTDPDTGYLVFTEKYLARRGECCSSGCRHCPYQEVWKNAAETDSVSPCAS